MTMDDLENEIKIMLHSFRVDAKIDRVIKNISVQFVMELFGTIVCGVNRPDYKLVADQINQDYPGYRVVYIVTDDNMLEKKDEVLWALMRGGYIKWIRMKYSRVFNESIIRGNLGNKIIDQRLRIWNGQPKYKFLIDDNEYARRNSASYILSLDPGFFDYMPK